MKARGRVHPFSFVWVYGTILAEIALEKGENADEGKVIYH